MNCAGLPKKNLTNSWAAMAGLGLFPHFILSSLSSSRGRSARPHGFAPFALALMFFALLLVFAAPAFADTDGNTTAGAGNPPNLSDPNATDPSHSINPGAYNPAAVWQVNPNVVNGGSGVFGGYGGYGSGWIQMFRGNGFGMMADPGGSNGYSYGLRIALGVYSNALLIVASVMLLYYLLVMVTETAHEGVAGGKRTNQVWAPLRLVIAIGLLVPLSSGLNSAQYIALQVMEWGSNMATQVWATFLANGGTGSGSAPKLHVPDATGMVREVAMIQACKYLMNNATSSVPDDKKIKETQQGFVKLIGNQEHQALCGSIIYFGIGAGTAAFEAMYSEVDGIIAQNWKYFMKGQKENDQQPPPNNLPFDWGDAALSAAGALDNVLTSGWGGGAGAAGAGGGWVAAGSYFLQLAGAGSDRVSGTDTLPIVIGPKAALIQPAEVNKAFLRMVAWIVGKYKPGGGGGSADTDQMGDTVVGRKFVDLMLLFLDQMGVVSGLWDPGSAAFQINLNNNPLIELVDLGHRMVRGALDFTGMAIEIGLNGGQQASYAAQLGGIVGGESAGKLFGAMAVTVLTSAASGLLGMGIILGFFMPLLPFLKFVLSVMTWLISVLETLVCVPIIALAWLTPYGDGFGGPKVESGYHLVLHAFFRPVMTIFGLVAALLCFNMAAFLISISYYAITEQVGTFMGGMYVVAKICFGMMYVSALYTALNGALKVMDTFGRNSIRWLGGQSHEEHTGDPIMAQYMASQYAGQTLQGVTSLGQVALQFGGNASALNKSAQSGTTGTAANGAPQVGYDPRGAAAGTGAPAGR